MPRPIPTISTAARPGPPGASPQRPLAAYLWASPCTAIGVALGVIALLCGYRWQRHGGVLEVARPVAAPTKPWMLPIVAITFGHVVLGRSAGDLDRLRGHEHAHVAQYERWGPLFLLAYPLASLLALLRGRRPYHHNRFEVEARDAAMAPRTLAVDDLAAQLRFAALIAVAVITAVALMLADAGLTARSLGPPLQVTARFALLVFAAAFVADAVPAWRRWMPSLALAFATVHVIHLALILWRAVLADRPGMLGDPIGIVAYAGVLVVASHALVTARGAAPGRALRVLSVLSWWYLWAVFAATYAEPIIATREWPAPLPATLLGLLLAAALVRIAANLRYRAVPASRS